MIRLRTAAVCFLFVAIGLAASAVSHIGDDARLSYEKDGGFRLPTDYREWTYLSSGLDMSYSPKAAGAHESSASVFDNVFVTPESNSYFKLHGTWPDKTIMILEVRKAGNRASINQGGHFQTSQINDLEAHVKDTARFDGGWAFFGFDNTGKGKFIAKTASCYSCHQQHAAVDTTFVQFYPTLLPIAQKLETLSREYRAESTTETSH